MKLLLLLTTLKCLSKDIVVSWNVVKNATKYEVTYNTDVGLSLTETIGVNYYVIPNAIENRKYTITVKALDENNNQSIPSKPLSVTLTKTNSEIYLKQPVLKLKSE